MRSLVLVLLAACGDNNVTVDAPIVPPGHDADIDAFVPNAPDLRFQWVGAAPAFTVDTTSNIGFASGAGGSQSVTGKVWSPLQLSVDGLIAGNYSWSVSSFAPTTPIPSVSAIARSGAIASLESDLTTDLAGKGVVTSIDVLPDAYAYVVQQSGDTYTRQEADALRAEVDTIVQTAGNQGKITTAISASATAGQIHVESFSLQGDTTAYDTLVVDCTPADVATQATTLGQGGYFITAFGHVANDKMILVGTRVNANARTITAQTGDAGLTPDLSNGDAVVAWSFSTTATPATTIIVER